MPRTHHSSFIAGLSLLALALAYPQILLAGQTEPGLPTGVPASEGTSLPSQLTPGTTPPPVNPMVPSHPVVPQGEALPEGSEPEKSVVQIFNAFVEPLWDNPWEFTEPSYASGSGFLIDGNRVMTNAHVVAWGKRLNVRRYHDPEPYFAHVEFVGHDLDLAVLKVESPDFYQGMKPLEFGSLPKVRSSVITYGFPAGGQQISYTRGVVSRIEVQRYVHINNRSFLACQTDAAINPGNSGGPVIQNDKVVGVAFEGIAGLENTSYFIPTPVIHHFLEDISDGHYDGVPESGLHLASLTNAAYRSFLKLPADSKRGVRVDSILDIPDVKAVIQKDDVILQVGDYPVDEDGTITYDGNTVGASVAFDLAQPETKVPLKILRDGKPMDIDLPMHVFTKDRCMGNQYDTAPPFYIYGGLVFTALSLDYLKTMGNGLNSPAGREMIAQLRMKNNGDVSDPRPEPVVLALTLNSKCNANMGIRARAVVDKINGVRITCMADLPDAFAKSGQYTVIEYLPEDQFEVLDRAETMKEQQSILDAYHIPQQNLNSL